MSVEEKKLLGAREAAVKMLLDVCREKQFSHTVKGKYLIKIEEKRERALATRLFEGTLERMIELDYIIDRFSKTPVRKMKPAVAAILRITVYQIRYMDKIPDSAACNEAVRLTRRFGFSGLSGFVNGVARAIARVEEISYPDKAKELQRYLSVRYSIPTTLVEQITMQYGAAVAEQIFKAFQETEREISIRCLHRTTNVEELKRRMAEAGVLVKEGLYSGEALRIAAFDAPERLPLFEDGGFYIQDESSMQAVLAAGLTGNERVLDICAAPGGKTVMAADLLVDGTVEARDLTEAKMCLLEENIKRCRLSNVSLRLWDATGFRREDEEAFDTVLCDVPCSGLGIIGRKPDIKLFMTTERMAELCELQKKILANAVRYVKKGGVLVFSTCTINKDENMGGISFLKACGMIPESLERFLSQRLWNETTKEGYLQLLPGVHHTDGFFVARFRKPMV